MNLSCSIFPGKMALTIHGRCGKSLVVVIIFIYNHYSMLASATQRIEKVAENVLSLRMCVMASIIELPIFI